MLNSPCPVFLKGNPGKRENKAGFFLVPLRGALKQPGKFLTFSHNYFNFLENTVIKHIVDPSFKTVV
jgi:hypothetical protein